MVSWENVVGIAAILNTLGFTGLCFFKPSEDLRPFILAEDPVTLTSLSFWIDTPNKDVLRTIAESRKQFGFKHDL